MSNYRKDNGWIKVLIAVLVVIVVAFFVYNYASKKEEDEIASKNSCVAMVDDYYASNNVYTIADLASGIFEVNYKMEDDSASYSYVSVSMNEPENISGYSRLYIKFKSVNMTKLHVKFGDGSKTLTNLSGKEQTIIVPFNNADINTTIKLFLDSYDMHEDFYNENSRSIEIYEIGFIS